MLITETSLTIREARLVTPFLRKRYRRQKQGILDIAVVLQDGTKVDIELQVAEQKFWVQRKLFYLARMSWNCWVNWVRFRMH